jgi:hypothetical protein
MRGRLLNRTHRTGLALGGLVILLVVVIVPV